MAKHSARPEWSLITANDEGAVRSATVDALYWAALILLATSLPIPINHWLHISLPFAVVITVVLMEVLVFLRWGVGRSSKAGLIVWALLVPAAAYWAGGPRIILSLVPYIFPVLEYVGPLTSAWFEPLSCQVPPRSRTLSTHT